MAPCIPLDSANLLALLNLEGALRTWKALLNLESTLVLEKLRKNPPVLCREKERFCSALGVIAKERQTCQTPVLCHEARCAMKREMLKGNGPGSKESRHSSHQHLLCNSRCLRGVCLLFSQDAATHQQRQP